MRSEILKKRTPFILGLAIAVCFSFGAHGVEVDKVPAEYQRKLKKLDSQLQDVEQFFVANVKNLESDQIINTADVEDPKLDKALQSYASDMKDAFDEANNDAAAAAKSEGTKGNTGKLKAFEELAKAHERRLQALGGKGKEIEGKIKSGKILPDKAVLESATPEERDTYFKFLDPDAQKKLKQLYPDFFKEARLNLYRFALALNSEGSPFSQKIGRICFICPAEASVAVICVAACSAQEWVTCLACCINAGPTVKAAYDAKDKCWKSCKKVPSFWRGACRVACVGVLVALLA